MGARGELGYDRHITIFSPDGNLYQVEYSFKAVKNAGVNAVGACGADCAVVVSQKQVPQDDLLDPSCVTSMHRVSDRLGLCAVGRPGDCRAMAARTRQEAAEWAYNNGYEPPALCLAQKIADINQMYTQMAYMRLSACVGMLIAVDDGVPTLCRFDPAGWTARHTGCAAGPLEQALCTGVEAARAITQDPRLVALRALVAAVGHDVKARHLEVAVVTRDDPSFRLLPDEEVEGLLQQVADLE